MAIADGKVSLKHLVTMETLTNEEVLGLIRRGGDFKNGRGKVMEQSIGAGQRIKKGMVCSLRLAQFQRIGCFQCMIVACHI